MALLILRRAQTNTDSVWRFEIIPVQPFRNSNKMNWAWWGTVCKAMSFPVDHVSSASSYNEARHNQWTSSFIFPDITVQLINTLYKARLGYKEVVRQAPGDWYAFNLLRGSPGLSVCLSTAYKLPLTLLTPLLLKMVFVAFKVVCGLL